MSYRTTKGKQMHLFYIGINMSGIRIARVKAFNYHIGSKRKEDKQCW